MRKLSEAALTIHLEEVVPRRRMLKIYLNVVEFGTGIYGAEEAAQHYFNKPASDLSPRESALLAASLPRPKSWHPGIDDDRYSRRASRIQTWMTWASFLNRHLWVDIRRSPCPKAIEEVQRALGGLHSHTRLPEFSLHLTREGPSALKPFQGL